MADAVLCSNCGAAVLEEVTSVGVRPVGSDEVIPFRRTTDYVVCPECFMTFSVRDLIAGSVKPDTEGEAEVLDIIEHLERLAEKPPQDEPS